MIGNDVYGPFGSDLAAEVILFDDFVGNVADVDAYVLRPLEIK